MRVLKYSFPKIAKEFQLEMPYDAEVINAEIQNDWPHFWAMVPENSNVATRTFLMVSTGEELSECNRLVYINTISVLKNSTIWHIFEKL
jgi:hypothetical protein